MIRTVTYLSCILGGMAYGQPLGHPAPMIRDAVDAARQVRLTGNTRPEATAANDRGQVPDDFKLDHLLLHLKRSPEREAAAVKYIDELHDATSPNYHKWLTPEQFAEHFGVAKSQGFTIHGVQASGLMIDFSGTASQVRGAYHTEIHNLEVNGKKHFANMSDPQIPAALAPAVSGIVSLHNFYPRPQNVPKAKPAYDNATVGNHDIAPGDLATIYNLSPLFAAGITGKGQSIMVLEDAYLYSTGDWTVFRKTFGLARPYPFGTLSQVSPAGALTCENPGFQGDPNDPGFGDDAESAIDVDWATAAAPNAAIILAACTDTKTGTFGGYIALDNVLNGPAANLPSTVNISYGGPEADQGAAGNAFINSLYQQAVMEGVSVFVSSGDGLATTLQGPGVSTLGIQISGYASTPYNVAVGGTDFGYQPNGVSPSTYWSPTNSNTYASALSYIQEIPWNDSCASSLVASFLGNTSDTLAFCNSGSFHNTTGGSGGPSGCAIGNSSNSTPLIISGTCAGYPKPSYQNGVFGNPTDGVRDIPDVSLFAGNGFWAASYIICWSNPNGGKPCTGDPSTWTEFGGTSVSSPIMAGIQALVNQKTGSRWGNPNVTLYALANTEYGTSGSSACNSITVNKTANSCMFYDITQGDIDTVCQAGSPNCFATGNDTFGILSTSTSVFQPAYPATAGWDFTSGLGSVNAFNLVMNWPVPQN